MTRSLPFRGIAAHATAHKLVKCVENEALNVLGRKTFCWKYALVPEHPDSSVWVYSVYESVTFIAITIKENEDTLSSEA